MKDVIEKSNRRVSRAASSKQLPFRAFCHFSPPFFAFSIQPLEFSLCFSALRLSAFSRLNPTLVTFEKVTSAFLLPFFYAFSRGKTPQNAICYFVTFFPGVTLFIILSSHYFVTGSSFCVPHPALRVKVDVSKCALHPIFARLLTP